MASMYISRLRTVVKSGILSSVLGKESLLQDSVEILIGRGKSEFWNYRLIHSIGIASFTESQVLLRPGTVIPVNTDSLLIHQRRNFSVVGEVSVAGPLFQVCGYHVNRALCDNGQVADSRKLENKLMDASCPSKTVFGGCISDNLTSRIDNCQFSTTNSAFSYRSKRLHSCSKASMSLKNREQPNNSLIYGYVAYNLKQRWSTLFPYIEKGFRDFHSSSRACFSAGPAPDVTYENSALDDQVGGSAASSEEKISAGKTLKLLSGSCYLPHPDKEETGGEDAHFICSDEQAIGVADGVGGWADLGIDAGQYSRELMSNSVAAIQEEPKGSVDPARVLEKAHSSTKAKGSSTACIIALTDQGLHAINLGDSGFMVVRDGCTIFRSPVQQHDFNFTYQLESGDSGDLPSSGQIFTVPVAPGDVIIAGTDGLFDNLYNNEITAVVVHAMRAGLGPQVTAQKIAALARQRAQDSNRQTPFSTAAQDAGFRYYGGKLDDITVVVSYVTSSEDENQSSSQASGFV